MVVALSFPVMPHAWPDPMVADGGALDQPAGTEPSERWNAYSSPARSPTSTEGPDLVEETSAGRGLGHAAGRVVQVVDPGLRQGEGRCRLRRWTERGAPER